MAPARRQGAHTRPAKQQVEWMRFLALPDLAAASQTCKSWLVLVHKAFEAEFASRVGVAPPNDLTRVERMLLLRKLRSPLAPQSFGYLLMMAAGR